MYQVLIDGRDLYYPGDEEYSVEDAVVKLKLNDSGTFECGVPVQNPEYGSLKNRNSMLQVLKNGKEIFYGEVRESEKDFYGIKQVYAVGELAFLFDSIQPQAKYQDKTARQLLEIWLNEHNSQVEDKKKFYVGMVTVHDSNDSLYRFTDQETTLDCIREKLCEKLDGYLRIRKANGKRYLDLITLQEYGKICEQPIEFGENLLDYAENVSANELYTCVIPKGARLEKSPIEGLEAYVDITSVNGGKDYLYSADAVAAYGWNRCVVSWDDVTEPANLKKKGEKWLKDNQFETMTLSLTAADMSLLDTDLESFELGDSVPVYSESHGMDRTFPVQSLELHLQNPSDDKLQLGSTMKLSYTEQNKGHYQYIEQALENNRQTTSWLQSAIDNATAMMTGSRGGYKVTEFDEKGRWLRDLYMNAPSKEDATQVMQINMNGIGFSRNGFGGPYKNAWTIDGVLLGEFIKAGSVQAEALSAEYKTSVTNEINTMVTAKFKVAENLVQAEVTRAKGAEETLRSSLSLTDSKIAAEVTRATQSEGTLRSALSLQAEQIAMKVSKGSVSSQLSVESGLISIKGPRLEIDTEKFKVAKDGTTRLIDAYLSASDGTGGTAIFGKGVYMRDAQEMMQGCLVLLQGVKWPALADMEVMGKLDLDTGVGTMSLTV
nr:phage tail protein [uncultured Blautia sp.]